MAKVKPALGGAARPTAPTRLRGGGWSWRARTDCRPAAALQLQVSCSETIAARTPSARANL
ncbi:hypothetical protein FA09DRAFT_329841 [Tilletiopsis washingtonensis]|uniref:Uncharacterized protein n=1 Tax=Tilletiopsis washingtonensis TaxID=58919 RepID=A0A316ZD70_9BASI|nr:hypothetical protein FA09DRAFT_329841 [Tilletiopsis washingtonensis]PWN98225.1 hypothetical protein FA09DRAFT_329841 [Tilletiopsis washingtonensis]